VEGCDRRAPEAGLVLRDRPVVACFLPRVAGRAHHRPPSAPPILSLVPRFRFCSRFFFPVSGPRPNRHRQPAWPLGPPLPPPPLRLPVTWPPPGQAAYDIAYFVNYVVM